MRILKSLIHGVISKDGFHIAKAYIFVYETSLIYQPLVLFAHVYLRRSFFSIEK